MFFVFFKFREAVQNCPEDDEENKQVLSAEEKQKQFDTKQKNIEEIVGKQILFDINFFVLWYNYCIPIL